MKKIRKGTQLKLTNPKNAGRPAIHDIGIRHIKRAEIRKATPLHLTIKLIRADIQNKIILKALRRAIMRARLQGLPDWFDFMDQPSSSTYKQLGNGVNIGAVYNVLKALVIRDLDLLKTEPELVRSIISAPANPDEALASFKIAHSSKSLSKPTLQVVKDIANS